MELSGEKDREGGRKRERERERERERARERDMIKSSESRKWGMS